MTGTPYTTALLLRVVAGLVGLPSVVFAGFQLTGSRVSWAWSCFAESALFLLAFVFYLGPANPVGSRSLQCKCTDGERVVTRVTS